VAVTGWIRRHDPELNAAHKAVKVALAVTVSLAIGTLWIGDAALSTFAVFGSVAFLLFAAFPGAMPARLGAYGVLTVVGAGLIVCGTLASQVGLVAVAAMAVVGFLVLFSGVFSAATASGTRAALLAFVLPVTVPAPPAEIPNRLAGWAIAAALAIPLAVFVWPPADHDRLRRRAAEACRALADLIEAPTGARTEAEQAAMAAVDRLSEQYRRTLTRPVPLSTGSRMLARLVDQLGWLRSVAVRIPPETAATSELTATLLGACATVLQTSAECVGVPAPAARAGLEQTLDALADARRGAFDSVRFTAQGTLATGLGELPVAAGHELAYTSRLVGRTVQVSAQADARPLWQRLLGMRRPVSVESTFGTAKVIASGHLSRRSVWFQNSVRGAIGLALAVLIARATDVSHGFWVVLGTMSVLRTSALTTGSTAARALIGTTVGFGIGAGLVLLLGTSPPPLWVVLPVVVLIAGFAPEAVSFVAGQAAFTVMVVILFNIIQPVGWSVGLVRIEDVALGCLAGLASGILLWPHGAAAAIHRALAEGYRTAAGALANAVRRAQGEPDAPEACSAAAEAGHRLDDALREYQAERGSHPIPIGQLTTLASGADRLRLLAEAIASAPIDPTAPAPPGPAEALDHGSRAVTGWYQELSTRFDGRAAGHSSGEPVPDPVAAEVEQQVLAALAGAADCTTDEARLLWRASLYVDDAGLMRRRLLPSLAVLVRPVGSSG
jgi:uncharacterized membrane protein YccC